MTYKIKVPWQQWIRRISLKKSVSKHSNPLLALVPITIFFVQNTYALEVCTDDIVRTNNAAWKQNDSLDTDKQILGFNITRYKIKWFSGSYSGWYYPGSNDIDSKTTPTGGPRRMWSYFYDHTHSYCRNVIQTATPPYKAETLDLNAHRFHQAYYLQPHNTYEHGSSLTEWLDIGFRSVELDIIDKGDWENESKGPLVSHDGYAGPENCNSGSSDDRLGHCLQDIMNWVDNNPGTFPLLVFVDMKSSWDWFNAWKSDEIALLDEWIKNYMDNKFYKYSDLYTGNKAREWVAQNGWPVLASLQGKIIIALTGGKIGSVNQNMSGALIDLVFNYGRYPSTFMCPDVESDPEELDVGGKIDGISTINSQYFLCSNLKSRDHYQITANRAAQNKQLIHLWGNHVYGNTSYTYNYIAVAHGIQAVGQDLGQPSDATTWNGSIPFVGVRRSLPGYFKLKPTSNTNLCMDVEGASYGNGSDIHSWSCHNGDNQRFVYTGEGQLRPKGNNKYCVDINGGNAGNYKKMHLWDCDGGDSEKWQITPEGRFKSKRNLSYCMEAGYPSSQGVQWHTYSCGPWSEQHFWLEPVPDWYQTNF